MTFSLTIARRPKVQLTVDGESVLSGGVSWQGGVLCLEDDLRGSEHRLTAALATAITHVHLIMVTGMYVRVIHCPTLQTKLPSAHAHHNICERCINTGRLSRLFVICFSIKKVAA